jgi:hypothetical protein
MFFEYFPVPKKGHIKATIDTSSLGELHVWREQRYPGSLLVSDAFQVEMKKRKIEFFELRKARDI